MFRQVVHGDCRTLADVLPFADILVLEPPGTPLHGLSPFALLPVLRRGLVVPQSACLEAAFVESPGSTRAVADRAEVRSWRSWRVSLRAIGRRRRCDLREGRPFCA